MMPIWLNSDILFAPLTHLDISVNVNKSDCYCTVHVHVVIPFYDTMWSFWVEANICRFIYANIYNICRFSIVCLYLYCRSRSNCQERRVVIPLTSLSPPHVCACSKSKPGFSTSYVVVFSMFNYLRLKVVVRFVDIRGIVDHHCLNFLFIIQSQGHYLTIYCSY